MCIRDSAQPESTGAEFLAADRRLGEDTRVGPRAVETAQQDGLLDVRSQHVHPRRPVCRLQHHRGVGVAPMREGEESRAGLCIGAVGGIPQGSHPQDGGDLRPGLGVGQQGGAPVETRHGLGLPCRCLLYTSRCV